MWQAAAAGRVSSLSSIYNQHVAVAGTSVLNIPGGTIQSGDLILVWDWAQNSTTTIPTYNLNTGYTQISNIQSSGNPIFPQTGIREVISYKIADGSETQIQGITCDLQRALLIQVFRPDRPIQVVTSHALNSQVLIETRETRTIPSDLALIPSVVVSAYGNSGAYVRSTPAFSSNPLTYSSVGVEEITVATGRDWFTLVQNSSPTVIYSSTTLDPNQDQLQTFTTFYLNVM